MYSHGTQWNFGALCVKGDTLSHGNDWFELSLDWIDGNDSGECFDRLDRMLNDGASFPVQNSECRDGLFGSDSDIFLVWERPDLEFLASLTARAIEISDQ